MAPGFSKGNYSDLPLSLTLSAGSPRLGASAAEWGSVSAESMPRAYLLGFCW